MLHQIYFSHSIAKSSLLMSCLHFFPLRAHLTVALKCITTMLTLKTEFDSDIKTDEKGDHKHKDIKDEKEN